MGRVKRFFIDFANIFFFLFAAVTVVVIMVCWHQPLCFCSSVLLSWTLRWRWGFPSYFCLLYRTGMLSVRFHCKTYHYDLAVPFQPCTISLSTRDRANKSPTTLNPNSLCSYWFPHQGFRNQPRFDVADWELCLISEFYDTMSFINMRCDSLGCLISEYLFSIWTNWFYIVLMKSLCQTWDLLDLRRRGCCVKEIPLHWGGLNLASFGNYDFWHLSRHMGNATMSIVNSSKIVSNADI